MPPWSLNEALVAADFLKVPRDVVEDNYADMSGIARHFFNADSARKKVHDAVLQVDPKAIVNMVTLNDFDK
jgi:hypothetical protein